MWSVQRPVDVWRRAMTKGLHDSELSRSRHLSSMRRAFSDEETERLHSWMHANLIILDSKAQGILAFYSIALAVLTILYSELSASAPAYLLVMVFINFLVIVWAILPLARISFVYWNTTEEFDDPDRLLDDLLRLRDERTRIVRTSLVKGGASLVLFTVILLLDILRRATG